MYLILQQFDWVETECVGYRLTTKSTDSRKESDEKGAVQGEVKEDEDTREFGTLEVQFDPKKKRIVFKGQAARDRCCPKHAIGRNCDLEPGKYGHRISRHVGICGTNSDLQEQFFHIVTFNMESAEKWSEGMNGNDILRCGRPYDDWQLKNCVIQSMIAHFILEFGGAVKGSRTKKEGRVIDMRGVCILFMSGQCPLPVDHCSIELPYNWIRIFYTSHPKDRIELAPMWMLHRVSTMIGKLRPFRSWAHKFYGMKHEEKRSLRNQKFLSKKFLKSSSSSDLQVICL